jgi:hypothetical protein
MSGTGGDCGSQRSLLAESSHQSYDPSDLVVNGGQTRNTKAGGGGILGLAKSQEIIKAIIKKEKSLIKA